MSSPDPSVRAVWQEVENGNYSTGIQNKNALIQILDSGSGANRECAARALAFLSYQYPDEVHEALDTVVRVATEAPREPVRGNAMSIVAALAQEYPNHVARYSETISNGLTDSHHTVVVNATEALAFTTRPTPQGVLDVIDPVSQLLRSNDSDIRRFASIIFYNVSGGYSNQIIQYDNELMTRLSTGTDEITKIAVSGALYRIVDKNCDEFVDKLDDLDSILRTEKDERIQGNIIGILAKVGEDHPEKIRKFLPVLSKFLGSASDEYMLANTIKAIGHISKSDPIAVRDADVVSKLRRIRNRTDSQVIHTNISHVIREIESEDHRRSPRGRQRTSDIPEEMLEDAKQFANQSAKQVILEVDNFINGMSEGDETTIEVVDSVIDGLSVQQDRNNRRGQ